ncbi:hypothetical protein LAZ67_12000658 [Cordylochernes scorpioides]|uniref:HTH CENPB-type domain-containing protein n=1 Tax=Cordylochernes scorpioides TaxID=51811 RepID=A0ABY6L499_9ARAC|nr:hypothetical protein LAZ67_12000658 [Cordylochernes scorpioides]
MRNLREAIRQKRPDLWKNKNWLLRHDNAPAHTSLLVRDILAKNNTLMMPQPPYSPDLAPSMAAALQKIGMDPEQQLYTPKIENIARYMETSEALHWIRQQQKIDMDPEQQLYTPKIENIAKIDMDPEQQLYTPKIENIAYGRSTSMICSVLKRKESIKSVTPAKGLTIISKLRTSLHENMEKLLMVWKARAICGDLLKQTPQTSIDEASEESFKASRGWFENFKKRSGIHSVVRHGEAASSYMKAAEDYIKTFSDLIKAQGYISQQVFNCDETGLFWKKMPNRTYITAEEKMMPGHKPMKGRLTLALCANASGDCKIKPLLVYHSENPRAFKSHKILKEKLQVMWRSNPKAWVTRKFFVEWVNLVFGPTVKKYLQENNLPVQALLILDNAPAHPPNLEDDILEELKFIKVLYLPPNTTPILQPMDQQLWPEAVAERIYEELEPGVSVEEEIVSLGKSMGLEVEERDVNELIEEHTQELTTEEIQELQSQQHTEVMQVIGFEESEEEVISTSEIKEILGMQSGKLGCPYTKNEDTVALRKFREQIKVELGAKDGDGRVLTDYMVDEVDLGYNRRGLG